MISYVVFVIEKFIEAEYNAGCHRQGSWGEGESRSWSAKVQLCKMKGFRALIYSTVFIGNVYDIVYLKFAKGVNPKSSAMLVSL